MRLLIVSVFWIVCVPLGGGQTGHPRPAQTETQSVPAKPKQDILPQTTLDFKPVGDGLSLSASIAVLNHPVCGGDGTYYLNAIMLPKGEQQVIAVSPKDKDAVSNYSMASIMGLVNVRPRMMDAKGSDLYVLAGAAKSEDLINHDVQPNSPDVGKYTRLFILHFKDKTSAPDVIPLDLPFQPKQFAATSEGKFVFLGLNRTNQTAVLAVIDGSGEFEHYIDAYLDFDTSDSITANAPQRLKSQYKTMPAGAPLDFALTAAQFVHYRGSLLLLMPGAKARSSRFAAAARSKARLFTCPPALKPSPLFPPITDGLSAPRMGRRTANSLSSWSTRRTARHSRSFIPHSSASMPLPAPMTVITTAFTGPRARRGMKKHS